MEEQDIRLPQPDEIPEREKEDAMGAYLMMFATVAMGLPLPILNLIAAIIYHAINRRTSRFVRFHSLQSLYTQIPVSLINAAAVIWFVRILIHDLWPLSDVFIGFLIMALAANVLYVTVSVVAAVKARRGQLCYIWVAGRLSYYQAFLRPDPAEKTATANKPPV